jgi:hypothetical protein
VDSERYSTVQRPPRGEKQGSRDSRLKNRRGGRQIRDGTANDKRPGPGGRNRDGGSRCTEEKPRGGKAEQKRKKKIVAGIEKPISNFSGRERSDRGDRDLDI